MNVLSLFDGMSCGHQALDRIGIKVDNYYASEIDKYAIQITMKNYPDTIQIGDVTKVNGHELPKIDLLLGGSPCQSFSFAGRRAGMSTKDQQEILTLEHYLQLKEENYEFEGQSYLFWEYMRLLNEVKPTYFLLENVIMSKKWKDILSQAIGCEPIMINSSLLSAQNRKRLYWTNIEGVTIPEDRGILLKDILEPVVDEKFYLRDDQVEKVLNKTKVNPNVTEAKILDVYNNKIKEDHKSITLTDPCHNNLRLIEPVESSERKVIQLNDSKESNGKQPFQQNRIYDTEGVSPALCAYKSDLLIKCARMVGRDPENPTSRKSGAKTEQMIEKRFDEKSGTLTTVQKDNLIVYGCDYRTDEGLRIRENGKSGTLAARARQDESCGQLATINSRIRKLTPIECERLQTVSDNYTEGVSASQRYKMLGNGWTIESISHILSFMK
jgi:DNA (cytosine-5)-methyltransferase 3A